MSYDQNLADCEVALADLATVVNDQSQKLNAANQLLEQTIEVLEAAERYADWCDRTFGAEVHIRNLYAAGTQGWAVWKAVQQAKPLLDNLKALKKEGTE